MKYIYMQENNREEIHGYPKELIKNNTIDLKLFLRNNQYIHYEAFIVRREYIDKSIKKIIEYNQFEGTRFTYSLYDISFANNYKIFYINEIYTITYRSDSGNWEKTPDNEKNLMSYPYDKNILKFFYPAIYKYIYYNKYNIYYNILKNDILSTIPDEILDTYKEGWQSVNNQDMLKLLACNKSYIGKYILRIKSYIKRKIYKILLKKL